MPFLNEIAAKLVASGVGVIGTSIFLSTKAPIPPGDGPYLVIIETGGSGAKRTHGGVAVECPTAQLSVRALDYPTARARLKLAYDALGGAKGLHNVTLSGTFYQSIVPRQNPTDIGLEEGTARAVVAYNIEAEKQPS
jgi:hypothetical protein